MSTYEIKIRVIKESDKPKLDLAADLWALFTLNNYAPIEIKCYELQSTKELQANVSNSGEVR